MELSVNRSLFCGLFCFRKSDNLQKNFRWGISLGAGLGFPHATLHHRWCTEKSGRQPSICNLECLSFGIAYKASGLIPDLSINDRIRTSSGQGE